MKRIPGLSSSQKQGLVPLPAGRRKKPGERDCPSPKHSPRLTRRMSRAIVPLGRALASLWRP